MNEKNIESQEAENLQNHPEVVEVKSKLEGMSKDYMKKTIDGLRTEISQLSSMIDQLKNQREEHNAQARHYRSMRNNISGDKYSQIDKLRDDIQKEKEQRDECNEYIRENKQLRDILKVQVKEAWAKVRELRDKYYQMKDEVGAVPEKLNEEIRDLEWKQQTTSLDSEEDAWITKKIVELYEKAYTAHLIGFSSDELEKALTEAKNLSEEHEKAHENVLHYHEKGQMHHQRLQDYHKEINELQSGGDHLHEKYVEERQAADLAHQKIGEIYERIKLKQYLMDLIDEEQLRRRQEKALKLRNERIEETKKKQSSSKRLTLDELRLLMNPEDNEE